MISSWKNYIQWISLSCIALYSGILRFYHLGAQSLWIDEGFSINAAQAVLKKGVPILDSGFFYYVHIDSTYLIAFCMKLFGFSVWNPWSARLLAAMSGIAFILVIYFVTKKLTKSVLAALTSACIFALYDWQIAWSRQARGYMLAQLFFTIALFFFLKWIEGFRNKDAFYCLLTLFLATLAQSSVVVFIPAFFIAGLIHLTTHNKITNKISVILFILTIIGFLIIPFLPFVTISNYFLQYAILIFNHIPVLVVGLCIAIILGLFFNEQKITLAGIILIISYILLSKYSPALQLRYIVPLMPLIVSLYVYTFFILSRLFIQNIKSLDGEKTALIIKGIFYTVAIILLMHHIVIKPRDTYTLEFGSPQPDFAAAYSYIQKTSRTSDVIISEYPVLTNLYLNKKGTWLPISLTGRLEEINEKTIHGTDRYVAAPRIYSAIDLQNILTQQKGYVVFDTLAFARLSPEYISLIRSKTEEVYSARFDDYVASVRKFPPVIK
ncbi:MAG: glycosyltransferase family 39 protein [Candidatus Paceibacterota bacterium]|jgi:hypothetical protein